LVVGGPGARLGAAALRVRCLCLGPSPPEGPHKRAGGLPRPLVAFKQRANLGFLVRTAAGLPGALY
jgi:hypothetical protein